MDNNEMKVSALLERIGLLAANYEEQIADLRVYATTLVEEKRQLQMEVERLGTPTDQADEVTVEEPVQ